LLEVAHHVQAVCVCDHNVFVVVCFTFSLVLVILHSIQLAPGFPRRVLDVCAFSCSYEKGPGGITARRIQDWSADSHVRAFLASDQVRADKAVRAPVFAFLESAVAFQRTRNS